VKDAIQVLELEEVPELATALSKLPGALMTDVDALGNVQLGTAIRSAFNDNGSKILNFEHPDQLLSQIEEYLKRELFENTSDSLDRIEKLNRALGEQVENLRTDPEAREAAVDKALGRISRTIIGGMGTKSNGFRRSVIKNWIKAKKDKQEEWDQVQGEGTALAESMFRDDDSRADLLTDLEFQLQPRGRFQARIQLALDPFKNKLDEKLLALSTFPNSTANSAVRAFEDQVKSLEKAINNFNHDLIPWLHNKDFDNTEINKIHVKLGEVEAEINSQENDLEILDLKTTVAELGVANSQNLVELAKKEVEKVTTMLDSAVLNTRRASVLQQVAKHATSASQSRELGGRESLSAAKQKALAANNTIEGKWQAVLGARSHYEAERERGVQASQAVRVLNLPPLTPPDLFQLNQINVAESHSAALERVLRDYR
jgi:hypothetical protein